MEWAFVREFAQAQGKNVEQILRRAMGALQRGPLGWRKNPRLARPRVSRGHGDGSGAITPARKSDDMIINENHALEVRG
jgi:hypothetical protein